MRPRSGWLVGGAVAAGAVAALGLAVRFGPALGVSLALGLSGGEAWLIPFGRDPAREEIILVADGRELDADLYRPPRPRGALVLVHGLSPVGRRQPDLARLARLLAREGLIVLVPQFPGLATFALDGAEVAEIRAGLRYVAGLSDSVGIAGFSFGAGPALLAAADLPSLRIVGSFGGYADLRHVIVYITTGAHEFEGRRHLQQPLAYNRWKLLALLGGFVEHDGDRRLLRRIAERRLANPEEDTGQLEGQLVADGRVVLALALNRREDQVASLLAQLPPSVREGLDRLSPLRAVPRLSGRLLIAHGADDDSIPFTESLRLAAASGGRARVAILQTFHHTGPQPFWTSLQLRAQDGRSLVRLVDDLLTVF
jgi:hypothetical protein